MKKLCSKVLALVLASTAIVPAVGCSRSSGEKVDENKSQLYVGLYDGGVGTQYIEEIKSRFEEKYADVSFEDGKTGVQIMWDGGPSYLGANLLSTIVSDDMDVYFTEEASLYDYIAQGTILDITDLVTQTVNEDDGKTIYSKLIDSDKEALAVNGKYYAIPHTELYTGLSYDAGIFKKKNLYFADNLDTEDTVYPGTNSFVMDASQKKSCGPDGKYDTYDDGLPSSFMEFYKLIDKMKQNSVDAFVFPGMYMLYTNMLYISLYQSYVGTTGVRLNFDYDSNGEEVEIVTGFKSNGQPIIEKKVITRDNAYLLKQTAGLYYAQEFAAKVYSDSSYYYNKCTASTVSHINAQEFFMNSGIDGSNYIGMLMEGNYWYNEASDDGVFKRLKSDYSETYMEKDPRWMALPQQYEGRVTEGNGASPVLMDSYNSYAFINAKIKSSKVDLAKTFLSFCYSDAELINFTKTTNGITLGVNYDLDAARESLDDFGKSVLDVRADAVKGNSFARAISSDPIFTNNQAKFKMNASAIYWESTKGTYLYTAARQNISVKDFFQGMWISESEWKNSYNVYGG